MRILIVGYGKLGTSLAKLAGASGHECWAIGRSGHHALNAIKLRGDVTDPATVPAFGAMDAIVYCVSASERTDAGYEAAYPRGLRNVLAAAAKSGCGSARLLFVSSTGVYGQDDGSWVDEGTETSPSRFQGRRMLEAEQVALDSGYAATCLRLGGIYGPKRTQLLGRVKSQEAKLQPNQPHWTNRIHSEDAARALLHVLQLVSPPSLLNVCDAEPALRDDVLRWIASRTGAQLETTPADTDSPKPPTGKRVASKALLDLGFTYVYPSYREGYGG